MIQYGIIKSIDYEKNIFKVRLPIFETSEYPEAVVDAVLCYQPGNYNGYAVDDIVVLGFINNNITSPIILGKVFKGQDDSCLAVNKASSIRVADRAELPLDSTIGNLKYTDIEEAVKFTQDSKSEINPLVKTYIDELFNSR